VRELKVVEEDVRYTPPRRLGETGAAPGYSSRRTVGSTAMRGGSGPSLLVVSGGVGPGRQNLDRCRVWPLDRGTSPYGIRRNCDPYGRELQLDLLPDLRLDRLPGVAALRLPRWPPVDGGARDGGSPTSTCSAATSSGCPRSSARSCPRPARCSPRLRGTGTQQRPGSVVEIATQRPSLPGGSPWGA